MINLAFYKFVLLEQPQDVRDELYDLCSSLAIKGTILLATEGINGCVAGPDKMIEQFMEVIKTQPSLASLFADMEFKKSLSEKIPFRKLVVRIDADLIPMRESGVDPLKSTGKYVEPLELQRWLQERKDIILVDTRNDYEVVLGTFKGAIDPKIKTFSEFPNWVRENLAAYKNKTVVTFCTGGIRCEKATAFMQNEGFENVYQIHGGILKYLEATAIENPGIDNHYQGDCFVFDQRVAVDKFLNPAKYTLCFKCWTPLSEQDLTHADYKENLYCPHCKERTLAKLEKRKRLMHQNNERAIRVRKERALKMKANYDNTHLR